MGAQKLPWMDQLASCSLFIFLCSYLYYKISMAPFSTTYMVFPSNYFPAGTLSEGKSLVLFYPVWMITQQPATKQPVMKILFRLYSNINDILWTHDPSCCWRNTVDKCKSNNIILSGISSAPIVFYNRAFSIKSICSDKVSNSLTAGMSFIISLSSSRMMACILIQLELLVLAGY